MQLVTKIVAAYLVIVGLAVFLNLIATPLYHDGSLDYPTWKILNWFMTVAVPIILVVGFLRKRILDRAGEDGASTLDHVRGSFVFYGGIVLAMLYFWGWFWTLEPRQRDGRGGHVAPGLLPAGGLTVHCSGVHRWETHVECGGRLAEFGEVDACRTLEKCPEAIPKSKVTVPSTHHRIEYRAGSELVEESPFILRQARCERTLEWAQEYPTPH